MLPVEGPVAAPSQARQAPSKPYPMQLLSVACHAARPVLALLPLAPWGCPLFTPLVSSSPQPQHQPALPLQTCPCSPRPATPGLPWVCGQPCLRSLGGWGQCGRQKHPPPPQVAWGREEEWEGGRETGQPTAQLGCAGSPPRPHHPIYYPSAIHRARQMPPNKYPQTIGWEGPVRLLMNKHEGLWTQLPLFAKWDRLCSRRLKFSRGRAVFQCPPNRRGASFIS